MRIDIEVPNESDGFVFTSATLRGRGISPGDPAWAKATAEGALIPLYVESEDSALVRVVVDEALEAAEQQQWVGVVRSALRLPDGQLALCGGIAYVLDEGAWAEEFARIVTLPSGNYRATLYCYASAPNGRRCVEQADPDEPLGSWFRRTRPGETLPAWLHNLCVHDPSLDPAQEKQWRRAEERAGNAVVDLLLHMERVDTPWPAAIVGEDGFLEAGECRKPEPFPLGVPSATAPDSAPAPVATPTQVVTSAAAASTAATPTLPAIDGGPLALPVRHLSRVAQLAWLCHPYAHPEILVACTGKPRAWQPVEDAECTIRGNEWLISFRHHGQPADALIPLAATAAQLEALPDHSLLTLRTSRPKQKSTLGKQSYRGIVRDGIWHLDAAEPRVDAATLTEALALTEAMEGGRRFNARDEAEAIRIEQHVLKVLADYFGGNALLRQGSELSLRRRDISLFAHVAARVFWSRYAAIWPLQDADRDG